MAPPTQRSDLCFPFAHSLSPCVSVSTMCEVPCCRLDFRRTSLYLVSVHGTLYHFSPPEKIWCTSMQINGMLHSDHFVIKTSPLANVHRAQKLGRWRNIFSLNQEKRPSLFIINTLRLYLLSRSLHSDAGPKGREAQASLSRASADCMHGPASVQWANRFPCSTSLGQSLDWKIGKLPLGWQTPFLGRSLSQISSQLRASQFRSVFMERGGAGVGRQYNLCNTSKGDPGTSRRRSVVSHVPLFVRVCLRRGLSVCGGVLTGRIRSPWHRAWHISALNQCWLLWSLLLERASNGSAWGNDLSKHQYPHL